MVSQIQSSLGIWGPSQSHQDHDSSLPALLEAPHGHYLGQTVNPEHCPQSLAQPE